MRSGNGVTGECRKRHEAVSSFQFPVSSQSNAALLAFGFQLETGNWKLETAVLIQRVVTALLLLLPLLAAIWFAPTPWLYLILCGAGLLVAWEWAALAGFAGVARGAYVFASACLLALTWLFRQWWPWITGIAALWWLFAAWLLAGFPENLGNRLPSKPRMALLGQILLLPTLLAIAVLHAMPDGAERLIYALGLIFAADTGAYLAGRNFGKHKLAPKVSPGKTVEGAIGGLALCAAWALTGGIYAFRPENPGDVLKLLLLSLLIAVVSIVGDLTESMFKRLAGLKDSGHILPGHGGILDRVDSLLAALPVMALGLYLTGL
jgi:phosphatidate cytidylyltransferase